MLNYLYFINPVVFGDFMNEKIEHGQRYNRIHYELYSFLNNIIKNKLHHNIITFNRYDINLITSIQQYLFKYDICYTFNKYNYIVSKITLHLDTKDCIIKLIYNEKQLKGLIYNSVFFYHIPPENIYKSILFRIKNT